MTILGIGGGLIDGCRTARPGGTYPPLLLRGTDSSGMTPLDTTRLPVEDGLARTLLDGA